MSSLTPPISSPTFIEQANFDPLSLKLHKHGSKWINLDAFRNQICLNIFFLQSSHLLVDIFPCFHQNSITYICILENDIGKSLHVTFEWPYNKVLPRSHLSAISSSPHAHTSTPILARVMDEGKFAMVIGRGERWIWCTPMHSERVCVSIHPRAPHPAPLDICGHGTRSISIQQLSASQLSCVYARWPQTYQQIATAPHI